MIVYNNIEQGCEEWLQIRKGRATASQAKRVITATGADSKSRFGYMRELARECVIDNPQEFAGNKHTEWGQKYEEEARKCFEKSTGLTVHEVGFCSREDSIIGFSPDGFIMQNGEYAEGLEIKCPSVDKHVEYLMSGGLPDEYKQQVHWSLAASGLSRWYFMSYFPNLNPMIIIVEADEYTAKVKESQDNFVRDYKEEREKVLNAITPKKYNLHE